MCAPDDLLQLSVGKPDETPLILHARLLQRSVIGTADNLAQARVQPPQRDGKTEPDAESLSTQFSGRRRVSGRAREPRWGQGWARHDGGVVLLERVPRVKRNAVVICLLKAYRQARAAWRDSGARNGNEPDSKMHEEIVA